MSKPNTYIVFIAGLFFFSVSFAGSYYWASKSTPSPTDKQKNIVPEKNINAANDDTDDTKPLELSRDDWESFVAYEGPRERMLGVKQKYSAVNFRDRPSLSSPIISTPEGGHLLVPLDRFQGWYRARLEDGRIGWIHESIVRLLNIPKPIAKKIKESQPSLRQSTQAQTPSSFFNHTRLIVDSDRVNLRQGPGKQFGRIGRVYRHQILRLMARRKGWARIQTPDGIVAWLHTSLTSMRYAKPRAEREKLIGNLPSLYYGPEIQFRKMQIENDKVTFEIIDSENGWEQLELESGTIGWIQKENLEVAIIKAK
jgi:SH3-like domain-containing protein